MQTDFDAAASGPSRKRFRPPRHRCHSARSVGRETSGFVAGPNAAAFPIEQDIVHRIAEAAGHSGDPRISSTGVRKDARGHWALFNLMTLNTARSQIGFDAQHPLTKLIVCTDLATRKRPTWMPIANETSGKVGTTGDILCRPVAPRVTAMDADVEPSPIVRSSDVGWRLDRIISR